MTAFKKWGKMVLPKKKKKENLEQQCGDGSIILSGDPKDLAFLGLPLGASITQIKVEKIPREQFFLYFSTQESPKGVLTAPQCLHTFVPQQRWG